MLLTTCPNCAAQFKVQPEQLNVRQGRVMCGRCRQVFNAFQSLTRISDDEATAAQSSPSAEVPAEIPAEASAAGALFLREEPMPAMPLHRAPMEKEFYAPPPEEQEVAAKVTDEPAANLSEPSSQSTPSDVVLDDLEPDEPAPSRLLLDDTPVAIDPANPLLSAGGSRKERPTHSRSWALGGFLLFLLLAAQGAYAFRSVLVQNHPPLRSVFVSACEWAGCSLSWSRDDSVLRIEASDLIEPPGKAGRIQLTATLVNRGTIAQDYPALELKLTDNANQVQLSRILQPQDYLGRVPGKDEGLQPNVETFVNLNVEVTNRVQASGYGVRAFYP
ncbi:MAG: zinc-ribbon and DUF3426 domain-containing protein [Betaproteobacteria bacterium]|nr:zinc-ribbon and DUF3426 domain-containing protein [Betaproteobacteria bacterium]